MATTRGARRIKTHARVTTSLTEGDPRLDFERAHISCMVGDFDPANWRLRKSTDGFNEDGVPIVLHPFRITTATLWGSLSPYAQDVLDSDLIVRAEGNPVYLRGDGGEGHCLINVSHSPKRTTWINDILWPAIQADFDAIAAEWAPGPDGLFASLTGSGVYPHLYVNLDALGETTAPLTAPGTLVGWDKVGWDQNLYRAGVIATYQALLVKMQAWKPRPYVLVGNNAVSIDVDSIVLEKDLGIFDFTDFFGSDRLVGSQAEFILCDSDGTAHDGGEIQGLFDRYTSLRQTVNGPRMLQLKLTGSFPPADRLADLRMGAVAAYYLLYNADHPDDLTLRISLQGETVPAHYPEYDIDLGDPVSAYVRDMDVYTRPFERGIVYLNARPDEFTITVADGYELAVCEGGGSYTDTGSLQWVPLDAGPFSLPPGGAGVVLRKQGSRSTKVWETARTAGLPVGQAVVSAAVDTLRNELYLLYRGTTGVLQKAYRNVTGNWMLLGPLALPGWSAYHALGYDAVTDRLLVGGRGPGGAHARMAEAVPNAGAVVPGSWSTYGNSTLTSPPGLPLTVDHILVTPQEGDPTQPARTHGYLVSDSTPSGLNGAARFFIPGSEALVLEVLGVPAMVDQGSFFALGLDHISHGVLLSVPPAGPALALAGSGLGDYQQLDMLPATELQPSFGRRDLGVIYHVGYHAAQGQGWIYPVAPEGPGSLSPSTFPTRCFGGWVGDRGDGVFSWVVDAAGVVYRNRNQTGDVFVALALDPLQLEAGDSVIAMVPHPDGGTFGVVTQQGGLYWFTQVQVAPTLNVSPRGSGSREGLDVAFRVTLDNVTTYPVIVNWTTAPVGGNPATGDDFVGGVFPTGQLTIQPGFAQAIIQVPTAFRSGFQGTRTFELEIAIDPSTGFAAGIGTGTAQSSILDSDETPSLDLVGVTTSSYEGNPTRWRLELSAPVAYDVSVNWIVAEHTGAPFPAIPADFPGGVYPSGNVVIAAGQTAAEFEVPTAADAIEEVVTETYLVRVELDPGTAGPVEMGTVQSIAALLDATPHTQPDGRIFYTDEATIGRSLVLFIIREDGLVWDRVLEDWSASPRSSSMELPLIELEDEPGTHALEGSVPTPELGDGMFARVEEAGDSERRPLAAFAFAGAIDIEFDFGPFLDLSVGGTAVDGGSDITVGRLLLELLSVAKGMWRAERTTLPGGRRVLSLTLHVLGSNAELRRFKLTLDDPLEGSRRPPDAI